MLGPREVEGHENKQSHVFASWGDRYTQACVIHGRLCLLTGPQMQLCVPPPGLHTETPAHSPTIPPSSQKLIHRPAVQISAHSRINSTSKN